MTLIAEIRNQLTNAIKTENDIEKSILRVVLGEVSTLEGRSGKTLNDEEVKRVIKKLIQSNQEVIFQIETHRPSYTDQLKKENEILMNISPPSVKVTAGELKNKIMINASVGAPILSQIKTAKGEGQAMGICFRFLKEANWEAEADDVRSVVQDLRSN